MSANHRTALLALVSVLSLLLFSMLGCNGSDNNTTSFSGTNNVNLTIELANPGQGLTQPAPGIHSVASETPVKVLVSPRAGYVFSGWQLSGDGFLDDPNAPVTTVTLSGDAVLMPQAGGVDEDSGVAAVLWQYRPNVGKNAFIGSGGHG